MSNTQYESSEDTATSVRDLFVEAWTNPVSEWRQRTWWGRLLWPLWLLGQLVLLLTLAGLAVLFEGPGFVNRLFNRSVAAIQKRTPDTYRGEQ